MNHTLPVAAPATISLQKIGSYRGIRVLAWDGDVLYASRGYELLRISVQEQNSGWESIAPFHAPWWRTVTARNRLSSRLARDGFHALAILSDGTLIGAVPGAIVTRAAGSDFAVTHRILRGTRPLHISAADGRVYWGEYFDNRDRREVYIYVSEDRGHSWQVGYAFPRGAIRHVHNIVDDPWMRCLWIFTGDEGKECRVLRASYGLSSLDTVLEGNQQVRGVAGIPTREGLFFSTDTPYEQNHVYRLDCRGTVEQVTALSSSSLYGCRVHDALFFSTMAEPSARNESSVVQIEGCKLGGNWRTLAKWNKDHWPMRYFQYGNVVLPDGPNATKLLAATTVGVANEDATTFLWAVT